jgi:hypothetical protein
MNIWSGRLLVDQKFEKAGKVKKKMDKLNAIIAKDKEGDGLDD